MTIRNKIDSNETGLAIAKEVIGSPGVLPGPTEWFDLEPNEYSDFGGEPTLLARRPINSSRQRKKGSIVDLEAKGGFNQDFTNDNSQLLVRLCTSPICLSLRVASQLPETTVSSS